jgi:uncharacterized OB-fold protein
MQTTTAPMYNASIVSISDDVKTKSNGKQYLTAVVKFTDGPLSNKTYFAQRTLGENKAAIHVGQSVKAVLNIVEDDKGVKRPFFEISTSRVDSAEDIMASLGL